MRLADSFWLINLSVLLALILGCRAGSDGSQAAMMSRNPTTIALCTLTMAPKADTETLVEVDGRITATKEGIDMWDPSCSNRGVDLSVDFDSGGVGLKELEQALKEYGLSDHPVIATVDGSFIPDHYDSIRHRKRTILVVKKVSNIHQSSAEEHR